MPDVNLIAAVGKSGQIGLGERLPWNDPEDLRWFRNTTMGGFVIMGGTTIKHVPDMEGRILIGWGRDMEPRRLLKTLSEWQPDRTIWIAGGAHTYRAFMPYVRRSFITHIDYDGEADVFMPGLWRNP